MPSAVVNCAAVSYIEERETKDLKGQTVVAFVRHTAVRDQEIELSDEEYARLNELGALREPGTERDDKVYATPFGVPVPTDREGELAMYEGPVMGDPRPGGLERIGGLTPEEAAAFERQADGGDDFDASEASADDVKRHIESNKLNVADTVALAGDDPETAEVVLEAELSRANPRQGVVDQLEAIQENE